MQPDFKLKRREFLASSPIRGSKLNSRNNVEVRNVSIDIQMPVDIDDGKSTTCKSRREHLHPLLPRAAEDE